jgi:membrane protein YqaA with SNARE-associated domain
MGRRVAQLRALAFALGAPGLALVAFVDSSFLSLPEVVDLMVIAMVTRHKALLPLYVISATVGSVLGCLVIYVIGRKGGEPLVRKRLAASSVDRTLAALRRHGIVAVMIPAILPPPMPFKPFVFLAGVAGITSWRFVAAVSIARGARYLALGLLAVRYGAGAMEYARGHTTGVSLAVVGLLVFGSALYLLWRKSAGLWIE